MLRSLNIEIGNLNQLLIFLLYVCGATLFIVRFSLYFTDFRLTVQTSGPSRLLGGVK